ncbi:MAG: DUF3868 domain-containing protein [Bacteroides sp.]|nr:DUF3868 domain-containing protein [Bacteroides sp.]
MKRNLLLIIYIICAWQLVPAQTRNQSEISRLQFLREGEDVLIQFEMNLSGRNLKSREAWIIVPSVETERRLLELPAFYITGSKMYRSLKRAFVLEKERYPIEPYRIVRAGEVYAPFFIRLLCLMNPGWKRLN